MEMNYGIAKVDSSSADSKNWPLDEVHLDAKVEVMGLLWLVSCSAALEGLASGDWWTSFDNSQLVPWWLQLATLYNSSCHFNQANLRLIFQNSAKPKVWKCIPFATFQTRSNLDPYLTFYAYLYNVPLFYLWNSYVNSRPSFRNLNWCLVWNSYLEYLYLCIHFAIELYSLHISFGNYTFSQFLSQEAHMHYHWSFEI